MRGFETLLGIIGQKCLLTSDLAQVKINWRGKREGYVQQSADQKNADGDSIMNNYSLHSFLE